MEDTLSVAEADVVADDVAENVVEDDMEILESEIIAVQGRKGDYGKQTTVDTAPWMLRVIVHGGHDIRPVKVSGVPGRPGAQLTAAGGWTHRHGQAFLFGMSHPQSFVISFIIHMYDIYVHHFACSRCPRPILCVGVGGREVLWILEGKNLTLVASQSAMPPTRT